MNARANFAVTILLVLLAQSGFAQNAKSKNFLPQLTSQADSLSRAFGTQATAWSEPALSFLSAAGSLKPVPVRVVWRRRSPRLILRPDEYEKLSAEKQEAFQKFPCDESIYYGVYSTPLAWARAFDRLGQHDLKTFDGKRILDFGFGNVGQLRMIASLGGEVTGVEIRNSLACAMYRFKSDQGEVEKLTDTIENTGSVKLVFGKWPAEKETAESVGNGYDLVVSKNVLKLGYIHPEREAPASQLVDLGVDDETFLTRLHEILNPGGYVMVYNIHPPKSNEDEAYKPWAYGETPWDRKLVEKVGFEVVEWHIDDSDATHEIGKLIGWDSSFKTEAEFEANFRAMYTILRKPE